MTPEEKNKQDFRFLEVLSDPDFHSLDKEFTPYLFRINGSTCFATLQCCTGHPPDSSEGFLSFRSSLEPRLVISDYLLPLEKDFAGRVWFQVRDSTRLTYVIRMNARYWEGVMKRFCELIEENKEDL